MSTTQASAISGTTPSAVPRKDSKGALDGDAFLRLMMAQMRNQDPMQPTDSAQMMAQLAQFTSVEQLLKLSEGMSALRIEQDFSGSVSLIGHTVTYRTDDGQASGVVTSVSPDPDGSILHIGDHNISSGDVLSVS
jgi:flagellar basal-body rod modification protein FlgD